MRRALSLAAGAAVALVAACASQGAPPGGPEDRVPPRIVSTMPDTNAVNVPPEGRAVFRFDEVVSERVSGSGGLSSLVLVSPDDGEPRVSWHREEIHVRPRRDWRRDAVYTITLLPGIADLRGNVRRERFELVFATGGTIAQTRIDGVAFDWVQGRPLVNARVEALAADSTRYVTRADSVGRFRLRYLPPSTYRLRAFADANNNRTLDPREAWDSATVALRDTQSVELYAFLHDSLGPRMSALEIRDSVTLAVTLDHALDPAQPLDTSLVRVVRQDSAVVPVVAVRDARAIAQAAADSVRAARDTTRRGAVPPLRRPAPADTLPPPPAPRRAAPPTQLVLTLGAPLRPNTTYRVTARALRSIQGDTATSTRTVTVPEVAPPPAPGALPRPAGQPPAAPAPATRSPGAPIRRPPR